MGPILFCPLAFLVQGWYKEPISSEREVNMSKECIQKKSGVVLVMVILLGLVWVSCSTVERKGDTAVIARDAGAGKYYFFDDVLIPKELNYKPGNSFIYETTKFKAGTMVFSAWWVDTEPMVSFFTNYMEKDNWKLVNSFREKDESILNFSKPEKTCTIKIAKNWYGSLEVVVRVGPLA